MINVTCKARQHEQQSNFFIQCVKTDKKGKIENQNGTYKNTNTTKTNEEFDKEVRLALGMALVMMND